MPSHRYNARRPKKEISYYDGDSSSDYEPGGGPEPWIAEPRRDLIAPSKPQVVTSTQTAVL